jgi:hypothetical protein
MVTILRNRDERIWRGSPVVVMALVITLLSVFAWGLQYKLSLYKVSDGTRPTMPAAKLLSPKEFNPVAQLQPKGELRLVASILSAFHPVWNIVPLLWLASFSILARPRRLNPAQIWVVAKIYSRPPPPQLSAS